jgi:ribosomal protein L12E/L44/L45/RPP1/RPP2
MSNTVGSINIEMLANLASLVSDMGKAHAESTKHAKEMAREWKESLDGIEEGFKGLAEIAGIAIGVEALREVAVRALEAAEQIDHMSQSLGVSVEKIQVMSFAAGLVGGNLDTVTTAFTRMERAAEQAVSGSAQQAEAFRAIGISASQLKELLKSPDQLIQQVAEHLGQFDDGAGKTAVTMQIFGRNAGQIIPYLNQLGRNFDELHERAIALGIVLSQNDQHLLTQTQEALNEAGQAAKGLGNQFAVALSPAIKAAADEFIALAQNENVKKFFTTLAADVSQFMVVGRQVGGMFSDMSAQIKAVLPSAHGLFDGMGGDLVSFLQEAQDTATKLGTGFKNIWVEIKLAAEILWRDLANGFNAVVSGVFNSLASVADFQQELNSKFGLTTLANQWAEVSTKFKAAAGQFKEIPADIAGASAAIEKNTADAMLAIQSHKEWADATRASAAALRKAGEEAGHAGTALDGFNAHIQSGTDKTEHAREAFEKYIDALNNAGLGKFDKQFQEYLGHVDSAHDLYLRAREAGLSFEEATKLETSALNANNDALARQDNLLNAGVAEALNKITLKYREQIDGLKGVTREQEIEKQYLQDLATFQAAWTKAMGDGVPVTDEMKQKLHELAAAHTDEIDAAKKSAEVEKQWQQIAVSGFDSVGNSIAQFATGGIKTWHDFGQSLIGDAKQFIAAIIQQFLKLTVFNGIVNSLFGLSGSSALPTGLGGGILGSVFGGGAGIGGATGGGSSVASGLFSPSSWTGAGQNMFSGFQSAMNGAGNLWASATGASTYSSPIMTGPPAALAGEGAPGAGAFAGAQAGGSLGYGAYGGYNSALGQGLGVVGGVAAGIGEYKNAGGGLAGVAGGLAYGVGTYYAGAAISTAFAGGISAGLAVIPVVGWIAIAAMLVDKFSGGKLFGTAATKFQGGTQTETISATGGDVDASGTFKGQRALFGGSYTKTKDIPVSAEAQKAADDLFAALKKGQTDFVGFFGDLLKGKVVDVVGGSLANTFDKNGKVTGTTEHGARRNAQRNRPAVRRTLAGG